MKKYIGAKYLGNDKISINGNEIVSFGDITTSIPEREAIARPDFEPIYESELKPNKFKKYSEENEL